MQHIFDFIRLYDQSFFYHLCGLIGTTTDSLSLRETAIRIVCEFNLSVWWWRQGDRADSAIAGKSVRWMRVGFWARENEAISQLHRQSLSSRKYIDASGAHRALHNVPVHRKKIIIITWIESIRDLYYVCEASYFVNKFINFVWIDIVSIKQNEIII